jgi:ribosome-associated toxin RatA of RatAB toxin-antitoxin module
MWHSHAWMKELDGSAGVSVAAPVERCFELLAAVERYPAWHRDVVTSAEVVERDAEGLPARARARLHVAVGPLAKDFRLLLTVSTERPRSVRLTRIPHDASDLEQFDVAWRLREGAQTQIALVLKANLSVPRLLPVGGIGDTLANGFVTAAARALG